MQRTYYAPRWEGRARDVETWLSNSLAAVVAAAAVAAGVVGMLVAFSYIDTTTNTPFENGIVWMVGGLILAISATVFRREHHVVDPSGPTASRSDYRTPDPRPVDTVRADIPPHTH
ncbi:MAG TPA: hypothetical protein VEZ14_03250 [Dehalococcoidia bacterium]|nr:hypothetical protein [Dehalococcoidia bacterium]